MKTDRFNKIFFGAVILLVGTLLFLGLREFFSAFLGAIVFYTLFRKFMLRLTEKRHMKRSLSAIIIIVISFVIVVLPVFILVTVIYNKVTEITSQPDFLNSITQKITEKLHRLPFHIDMSNLQERATSAISQHAPTVLNSSLSIIGSLLMMYFFLYFLLVNTGDVEKRLLNFLPFAPHKMAMFGNELQYQTYSNAIGVPLVCIAQGLLAYVSYRIGGVPEAGLWGILTGFASVIPLVGTAIIWVPVAVYLLANGDTWQGLFVTGYSIAIMANVDNVIRMIVSRKVGDVHPVITVLGVIFGLKYFGLPGLVFGPLMISYFLLLLRLFHAEHMTVEKTGNQRLADKLQQHKKGLRPHRAHRHGDNG